MSPRSQSSIARQEPNITWNFAKQKQMIQRCTHSVSIRCRKEQKMFAIRYNGKWVIFDSLTEAEEFRENLFNKCRIDSIDDLEIVPYHWTMG